MKTIKQLENKRGHLINHQLVIRDDINDAINKADHFATRNLSTQLNENAIEVLLINHLINTFKNNQTYTKPGGTT